MGGPVVARHLAFPPLAKGQVSAHMSSWVGTCRVSRELGPDRLVEVAPFGPGNAVRGKGQVLHMVDAGETAAEPTRLDELVDGPADGGAAHSLVGSAVVADADDGGIDVGVGTLVAGKGLVVRSDDGRLELLGGFQRVGLGVPGMGLSVYRLPRWSHIDGN